MKLVIDIYEKEYERALNRELMYPRDLTSLEKIIANGKPLPKNPTNGYMIITLYPNLKYSIQNGRVLTTIGVAASFDLDWWNSPYKKEDEDGR